MFHYKDRFSKALFEPGSVQAETLLALVDDELEKDIIECTIVDGLTTTETADIVGYSERQIYRIKKEVVEKIIIKTLIEKQSPKEPVKEELRYGDGNKNYVAEMQYHCPICDHVLGFALDDIDPYCSNCGQAIISKKGVTP